MPKAKSQEKFDGELDNLWRNLECFFSTTYYLPLTTYS